MLPYHLNIKIYLDYKSSKMWEREALENIDILCSLGVWLSADHKDLCQAVVRDIQRFLPSRGAAVSPRLVRGTHELPSLHTAKETRKTGSREGWGCFKSRSFIIVRICVKKIKINWERTAKRKVINNMSPHRSQQCW